MKTLKQLNLSEEEYQARVADLFRWNRDPTPEDMAESLGGTPADYKEEYQIYLEGCRTIDEYLTRLEEGDMFYG